MARKAAAKIDKEWAEGLINGMKEKHV